MSAPAEPTARPRSLVLLDAVLDAGSYTSWDAPAGRGPQATNTPAYRSALASARDRAGTDESVITGEGRIAGHRVAVVCSEFAFLAGSIGVAAAERILLAVERATAEGLPLLAAPASGGTRMQEGTPAFLRMAAVAGAVAAHRAARLPYLVYLRHPTTGGVLASWGSLGHLTFAESGALVGFLGPKVFRALYGEDFPASVQTAENLHAHGLVDGVLTPAELSATVGRVLSLVRRAATRVARPAAPAHGGTTPERGAWAAVTATRRADRPGTTDLLASQARDVVPLCGTGQGEPGHGMVLALARFGAAACLVVGHERAAQERAAMSADALRTARRGLRLAAELGLPLVTLIDTPGAALSRQAEESGLAGEIARCLADLSTLTVPTVAVLLGQGCGGAALALLPADRVLAARHGWVAPLPPEGASAIVHGTPDRAEELATAQQIRSIDLFRDGTVDRIIDELPDAADEPAAFLQRVADAIEIELLSLPDLVPADRTARRLRRYRSVGTA